MSEIPERFLHAGPDDRPQSTAVRPEAVAVNPQADRLGNWVIQKGQLLADIPNGFIVVDLARVRSVRMFENEFVMRVNSWSLAVTYADNTVHTTAGLTGEVVCTLCDLIRANVLVHLIPEYPCEKRS